MEHLKTPKTLNDHICEPTFFLKQSYAQTIQTWRCNKALQNVIVALENSNIEYRFIGGCVRNYLLGHKILDFDLASPAGVEALQTCFIKNHLHCIKHGLSYGVVSVLSDGIKFDIASLRVDVNHDGRYADIVSTNNWEVDSLRRDFTVNALSIDQCGKLYDYHGGLNDLKDKKLRFIGQAQTRISEDYLRILRYFRLIGELGWPLALEQNQLSMCFARDAHHLEKLSNERIGSELIRIISARQAYRLIEEMRVLGIWSSLKCPLDLKAHQRLFYFMDQYRPVSSNSFLSIAGRLYSLFGPRANTLRQRWAFKKQIGRHTDLLVRYIAHCCGTGKKIPENRLVKGLKEVAEIILSDPHRESLY